MESIRTVIKIAVVAGAVVALLLVFESDHHQPPREFAYPINRFDERAKLLTFGLFVTPDPEQNPIDPPERFSGYHTAVDLEILPGEENSNVPVYAICSGTVKFAGQQNGYGGVIIQECSVTGQPATVLYGHVSPASFKYQSGERAEQGQQLAILAPAHSEGSGETRKHLHLGIHKGAEVEFRGYVQTESELAKYIDPLPLFQ